MKNAIILSEAFQSLPTGVARTTRYQGSHIQPIKIKSKKRMHSYIVVKRWKDYLIRDAQSCTATCFDVEGDILAIGKQVTYRRKFV